MKIQKDRSRKNKTKTILEGSVKTLSYNGLQNLFFRPLQYKVLGMQVEALGIFRAHSVVVPQLKFHAHRHGLVTCKPTQNHLWLLLDVRTKYLSSGSLTSCCLRFASSLH